eukprot:366944-Amphidinium_carterae.1
MLVGLYRYRGTAVEADLPQIAVAAFGRKAAKARQHLADSVGAVLPPRCFVDQPLALVVAANVVVLMTVEHDGFIQHHNETPPGPGCFPEIFALKGEVYLYWSTNEGGHHSHHSDARHASTPPCGAAPTTLAMPLARALANMSRVCCGSIAFDPCAGGGSLASVLAERGAVVLAGEVNLDLLRAGQDSDDEATANSMLRLVGSCTESPIRRGVVDAVVTDPPYGVLVDIHCSSTTQGDFFRALATEAARVLKPGGRFVAIWPYHTQFTSLSASELAQSLAVSELQLVDMALAEVDHRRSNTTTRTGQHWLRLIAVYTLGAERPPERRSVHQQQVGKPLTMKTRTTPHMSVAPAEVLRAAWTGDLNKLRAFTASAGDPNAGDVHGRPLLLFAAGYGRVAAVRHLCASNADPFMVEAASDETPLVRAS